MNTRARNILVRVCDESQFWIGLAVLVWMVAIMVSCAASATSEITGAKASASDKSLDVTAPSKRRMKFSMTVPGQPATVPVEEEGEDK